jgi:hypothetical protein
VLGRGASKAARLVGTCRRLLLEALGRTAGTGVGGGSCAGIGVIVNGLTVETAVAAGSPRVVTLAETDEEAAHEEVEEEEAEGADEEVAAAAVAMLVISGAQLGQNQLPAGMFSSGGTRQNEWKPLLSVRGWDDTFKHEGGHTRETGRASERRKQTRLPNEVEMRKAESSQIALVAQQHLVCLLGRLAELRRRQSSEVERANMAASREYKDHEEGKEKKQMKLLRKLPPGPPVPPQPDALRC